MIIPKLKKDLRSAQKRLCSFIKKQEKLVNKYTIPINPSNIVKCPSNFMYSNFAYVNDETLTDKVYQILYDTFYTCQSHILIRGKYTNDYQKRTQTKRNGSKCLFSWNEASSFIELSGVIFEDSKIESELKLLDTKLVSQTHREVESILNQMANRYESYIGCEVDVKTHTRSQKQMVFTGFLVANAPLQWDARRIGISFLDQDENEIVMYDTKRIRAIWS